MLQSVCLGLNLHSCGECGNHCTKVKLTHIILDLAGGRLCCRKLPSQQRACAGFFLLYLKSALHGMITHLHGHYIFVKPATFFAPSMVSQSFFLKGT